MEAFVHHVFSVAPKRTGRCRFCAAPMMSLPTETMSAKKALLSVIEPLDEGLASLDNPDIQKEVDFYIRNVEKQNQVVDTVSSPMLNGKWKLLYTTSANVLGKNLPAFLSNVPGTNMQYIDVDNGKGLNIVDVSVAGIFNGSYGAELELTAAPPKKVRVQIVKFQLGPLRVNPPKTLRASLEITYLDEDMRIGRGSRNNVFVLTKES
eukprot:Plantae.Rhodophyta-Purpureofilum_apyrenoidigerum.ctg4277.p1 GENE.Plantae.Rhodophyta-Purpureofilum_apyrenoidigerum.ctg4277~~Plantae.Rhodophyta-Purpureofilum_apyrenoidigerum.ctg4277.p1  ORF type:complete len:207 (+),score=31.93 Plantae.Rhodophyta-Purpureofilum_apyrenoidigerum.ctg4277:995-1615(+)